MTIEEFKQAGYIVTVTYDYTAFCQADINVNQIDLNTDDPDGDENNLEFTNNIINEKSYNHGSERYSVWEPEKQGSPDTAPYSTNLADDLSYEELIDFIKQI